MISASSLSESRLAVDPVVVAADGIVEKAVEGDRRMFRAHQHQLRDGRNRNLEQRFCHHLQQGDGCFDRCQVRHLSRSGCPDCRPIRSMSRHRARGRGRRQASGPSERMAAVMPEPHEVITGFDRSTPAAAKTWRNLRRRLQCAVSLEQGRIVDVARARHVAGTDAGPGFGLLAAEAAGRSGVGQLCRSGLEGIGNLGPCPAPSWPGSGR